MWFYQAINRLPAPRSYLGKILFVSFIGVHVPLIAAVVYVLMTAGFSPEALQPIIIVVLIATLAGTGLTFAVGVCSRARLPGGPDNPGIAV